MKLTTLTASFGRLEGDTLTLGEGLNIIHAPNEGGKSTWAGFLKGMLYGIDTRDRDKKGYLADKNRYQPWSGAPMEGEISLTWGGRDITLRRSAKGATPFGTFTAVYTGTQEPVPGLFPDTCGEFLVGSGREVYERSAFIGSGGTLSITAAPELERRIAALVSSGLEEVSFSQTEKQLKEWLRRRKHNNSGIIPRLEEEIAQITATLLQLEQLNTAAATLEGDQYQLSSALTQLTQELDDHQRLARRDLNTRYAQAKEGYRQAQAQLDQLRQEQSRMGVLPEKESLKKAQGELQFIAALDAEIRMGDKELEQAEDTLATARSAGEDPRFPNLSGEDAVLQGVNDATLCAQQSVVLQKLSRRPLWSVLTLLLFVGAAAGLYFGGVLLPIPCIAIAGAGLVVSAALLIQGNGAKKAASQKIAHLLERYGVSDPQEIATVTAHYRSAQQAVEEAAAHARQIRSGLEDRKARREVTHTDLLSFVHTFAPEANALFGCSAALSRALNLGEQQALAQARLEGARTLFDTLSAQGGQDAATLEEIHSPRFPHTETAARHAAAQSELGRVQRELAQLSGQQSAIGDSAALYAQRESLENQLERRRREYSALNQAISALTAANSRLQERFSPELNRRAGEYFAKLTGGRYQSLSLSRELEGSATESGGILPRRGLALSRGTLDQLYLAVRLAVCDLCLPQEEGIPLVLDDALAAFDDQRMALALNLLAELGKKRQILLFTCQKREGEVPLDIPVTHIAL